MKRVLLKLSGEALAGDKKMGFDEPTVIEAVISGEAVPVRILTVPRQIRSECWLLL